MKKTNQKFGKDSNLRICVRPHDDINIKPEPGLKFFKMLWQVSIEYAVGPRYCVYIHDEKTGQCLKTRFSVAKDAIEEALPKAILEEELKV